MVLHFHEKKYTNEILKHFIFASILHSKHSADKTQSYKRALTNVLQNKETTLHLVKLFGASLISAYKLVQSSKRVRYVIRVQPWYCLALWLKSCFTPMWDNEITSVTRECREYINVTSSLVHALAEWVGNVKEWLTFSCVSLFKRCASVLWSCKCWAGMGRFLTHFLGRSFRRV